MDVADGVAGADVGATAAADVDVATVVAPGLVIGPGGAASDVAEAVTSVDGEGGGVTAVDVTTTGAIIVGAALAIAVALEGGASCPVAEGARRKKK